VNRPFVQKQPLLRFSLLPLRIRIASAPKIATSDYLAELPEKRNASPQPIEPAGEYQIFGDRQRLPGNGSWQRAGRSSNGPA